MVRMHKYINGFIHFDPLTLYIVCACIRFNQNSHGSYLNKLKIVSKRTFKHNHKHISGIYMHRDS